MIHALIRQGQIELQEPVPTSWEGQLVAIAPLTSDDSLPDLEQRLAELHALGPMELDADERAQAAKDAAEMNALSRLAMERLMSNCQ